MKFNKILSVSIMFVIGFVHNTIGMAQHNNIADEVVWMVGDEPILKSDIEYQKLRIISEGQPLPKDPNVAIAEQIAIQKLFLNQAKIDSITADEGQVNRYVDMWLQNAIAQVGGKEKLEEYFNKPISQIREDEVKQARNGEIVRAMQQHIVQSVQVTPSDVRNFYNKLPKDSIPYVPQTVEVQMIAIKPHIALSEIDRIKSLLRGYADDIRSGKRDFSTIARLYSQDKRTAIQGGEYGYVNKSSLDPGFAQAVFNLTKKNPLSSVIKTDEGYHLVKLIDKRGDLVNFRQILLRPNITDSAIQNATKVLDTIRQDIEAKKFSFGRAAEYYSMDKDTYNNDGLLINKNPNSQFSDSPNFQYQVLPQEIAKQASKLKVGEISLPFVMYNKKGQEEVVIIKLKEVNPGHRANLFTDYPLIKQMALAEKREKKIDEWIRDRQKKTFIEINPNYRNGHFKYPGWIHDNN